MSRNRSTRQTVRLMCPICNTRNGSHTLDFKTLSESGGKVTWRKRHRRCRVRLLYSARPTDEGKIGVTVTLDAKGKADLARMFHVSSEEVQDVIREVLSENEQVGNLILE